MTLLLSNDETLVPRTTFDGPALAFEMPGLRVGAAEYEAGPTGCTVFHFPQSALVATDVRGGSPGVFMPGDGPTDAICFAGGSLYGLEACTGVAAELFRASGYSVAFEQIALVRGAIMYDFGGRANAIYPDKALGRAALASAREGWFPLGACGAGRSVNVGNGVRWDGSEPSGQGGAALAQGTLRLAVFVALNAIGMVHDRAGRVVRGGLDRASGRRRSYAEQLAALRASGDAPAPTLGNTTLTLVVTNAALELDALRQVGRQVHSALARAIQPFHTPYDGDVLFAASTGTTRDDTLDPAALGVLASDLAWDAVLRAVGQ
ncbi:MAG TPA: P1 family peptidase [Roseiflexaceae bacterium]|nr:P1 family peptidase [Roseiflexaceae bacterium]